MDYYKFEFHTSEEQNEILVAFLGELPFEVFEDTELGFDAYIPAKECDDQIIQEIENLQERFPCFYQKKLIKYQNWNAIWESNFKPIVVGTFCGIRADFHPPLTEVQHEIIINPKMAFGTGHHETTWMMIAAMEKLDFSEKKVFDFGCGTGILAILASQLGAEKIDALDIELPSYENTIENAQINQISNIEAIHGTLPKTQHLTYDIILANINRHVILDSLSTLHNMLPSGGKLLISGILNSDKKLVQQSAKEAGFTYEGTNLKNNWICMQLKK